MKKRLSTLACATLLTLLPLTVPTAAQAAGKCPKNDVCGWAQPHLKGKRYKQNTAGDHGCFPFTGRSVSNQSRYVTTFYRGSGCYGATFKLKPGTYSAKTPWKVVSVSY
ncbi:peptidase inhibitor family I36 protein [Streptomyces catenulae]|uniref:Peptidase inhibitor family I36 protein n=1 Tax=Streptomyces catenulae TaxID=66875 RepID=A0ABV2Z4F0_9ACTN|nr:peptidase inhibitor family I36 protein [Streptomyces catenulae]